jgi:xylulokinase
VSRLYLGLDSSTQSLSAVVIEVARNDRRVVFESSLNFDEALPHYGTTHGILPRRDPALALSSPLLWAEALDLMFERLSRSGLDMSRLAAISGSAQQHGSVYLNAAAAERLAALDPAHPLAGQVAPLLSRPVAPIWMDSSTAAECAEISSAVGGADVLAQHTGSRAFERFTGPQIRKLFKEDPAAYAASDRIHLISSYLCSLLAGAHAPLDPGDASGMNLMDLATRRWWPPALVATAPDLESRLPPIAPAWTIAGPLAPYWRVRHGLPSARVVVWSGDNPCSLVGTGLVREGPVAVSLGTSDTIFGLMTAPRVDAGGTGHVFGAPTGEYMGLTCFSNGSLARERIRDAYGLTWDGFSEALEAAPPGNGGRLLLPWFEPEITPPVRTPGLRRCGLAPDDVAGNVRGIVEAQMMAMAIHSRWMGVRTDAIHAAGGAAVSRAILQVMADVFGARVHVMDVRNTAALGAALRAFHADRLAGNRPLSWDDVVAGFTRPSPDPIVPDTRHHALYADLRVAYQACETRERAMLVTCPAGGRCALESRGIA